MSDSDEATKHDKPERVSQAKLEAHPDFGPRYRVIGPIGKGGMGEVFRAYDTELKGEVALKVVRGDADHDAALARFRREIALARKVTDPNVLRVYDLDEHDGLRFLSMEYVDGQDLAALMRRDGKMSIERGTALFRQVCQGLAAAHAQGVVHRDLKPQNVLVDKEGRVRVADFGLARSIGDSALTASGAVLGSPAYMSPEQVKGDPTDERSDIYSLGIMLYQLVTGETPFRGGSPHAIMEMRLHKKPALLRDVRPDAPAHLEAICAKCLALTPSARYASVRDVLSVLDSGTAKPAPAAKRRWLMPAIGGGAVAVAAAIAIAAWPRHEPAQTPVPTPAAPVAATSVPPPADGVVTVFVLGIENRTNDTIFDGTLDTVFTAALRMSKQLDPLAGPNMREMLGDTASHAGAGESAAAALAQHDHARVLTVRGTITPKGLGFTLAISVRDASSEKTVFDQTVEAKSLAGVLPAIARLGSGLRIALGEPVANDQRDRTGVSPNLDADREYSLALGMRYANNNDAAIAHLEQATSLDPRFTAAHVQLSDAYWNAHRRVDVVKELKLVLASIDQLGERDRMLALADYYDSVTEEHDRAITTYEQLLAIWPRDPTAETILSLAYQGRGDIQKSVEVGARAARHHPHNPNIRANLASFEVMAGKFEDARSEALSVLAEFPRPTVDIYEYLAIASFLAGHRDEAVEAYRNFVGVEPSGGQAATADFAIAEGRLAEAAKILEKGIADDNAHKLVDGAEIKAAMLAELRMRRGDKAGARAAALLVTKDPSRLFSAAITLIAAGDDAHAHATAARFADDVSPSLRALSHLIEAEALRVHGKPQQAVVKLQEALKLSDTAAAHYFLARAELDAKLFPQAYGELQTCLARRGELTIGVDDVPALREVPPLTYFLAKAQEGLGSLDAAKSYAAFLAMTHDPDADDLLVSDARKHVR